MGLWWTKCCSRNTRDVESELILSQGMYQLLSIISWIFTGFNRHFAKVCNFEFELFNINYGLERGRKKIWSQSGEDRMNFTSELSTPGYEPNNSMMCVNKIRRSYISGEENVLHVNDHFDHSHATISNIEGYNLPPAQLKPTENGTQLNKIYALSKVTKRNVINNCKRLKSLRKRHLVTSDQRIGYFRKEINKRRISFMEDSITLVIDRNRIVEDTLNQIDTTDGFDFHKEIKIFFIDEEAQDAGGVLKEWIFWLSKFPISTSHLFSPRVIWES